MAGAFIEAYAYSEGGSGATCAIDTVQTFATLSGTYVRPSSPQRFTTLLSSWATAMNAAEPGGAPWTFAYNATTRRVTINPALGLYMWDPDLNSQTAQFIGFGSYSGDGSLWQGQEMPTGRIELLGVTVEPAEDWTQTEVAKYRHGRAAAIVWGNHQIHRVTLHATGDAVMAFRAGWMQTGRVRLYQANSGVALNAYSPTNPAGYIDGWVIACGPAAQQSETWWSWEMLVGVPR